MSLIKMREIQYKDFSLKFHKKGWQKNRFNVCQFELTFRCSLHCRHCYADCYNNPQDLKKELNTRQIIKVLDKVYNAGVFWLCFTGGDPLARPDFLEIYTYAKRKGFVVTLFTSGVLITEKVADFFRRLPPFSIELTLNGVTQKTYEAISGVTGSFESAMAGLRRLKERKIPFQIKTQATRQNYLELDKIKNFLMGLGLNFKLTSMLFARLNQDLGPCGLRLTPREVLEIDEKFNTSSMSNGEMSKVANYSSEIKGNLFRCAAGNDTFHIDPYGNMFLCSTVRKPSINLLKDEIADGLKLFKQIKAQKFKSNSKCKTCSIWYLCYGCPGRAYLETGSEEAPMEYFCRLAHLAAKKEYA